MRRGRVLGAPNEEPEPVLILRSRDNGVSKDMMRDDVVMLVST